MGRAESSAEPRAVPSVNPVASDTPAADADADAPAATFADRLAASIARSDSLACVGLDPPGSLLTESSPKDKAQLLAAWGVDLIRQTHPYVCAFKPNLAFYEAYGSAGILALEATLRYLGENHPEIIRIGDAKRGDIGSTSEAHTSFLLDHLNFDAVTLNPYLGFDTVKPFLERADKGCIVVCRTSNPTADDFQLLEVGGADGADGAGGMGGGTGAEGAEGAEGAGNKPLWQQILHTAATEWNQNSNCLAVIGATRPDDLRVARQIAGEHFFFLVPGVGAQGADLGEAVTAGLNQAGAGIIVNSSRSIAESTSPAQAAATLRDDINRARGA